MSFEPRSPDFEATVRATFAGQAFMQLIGADISRLVPGELDLICARRPDLTQQHGYFHAGVTSAIADSAAGLAALTLFDSGSGVLTTEYKINLVAPGDGDQLIARGWVIRPGRTLTVCKSDVFANNDSCETLIATGLFTMMQLAATSH